MSGNKKADNSHESKEEKQGRRTAGTCVRSMDSTQKEVHISIPIEFNPEQRSRYLSGVEKEIVDRGYEVIGKMDTNYVKSYRLREAA